MGQTQEVAAEHDASPQSSPEWAQDLDKVVEALRPQSAHERRERSRAAVSAEFRLTPLDDDGNRRDDQAISVFGRNISTGGIAFRHQRKLAQRRAILMLEHPRVGRLEVEVEILWTRLMEPGWHESGGALLRTAEGHAIKTDPQPPAPKPPKAGE